MTALELPSKYEWPSAAETPVGARKHKNRTMAAFGKVVTAPKAAPFGNYWQFAATARKMVNRTAPQLAL